MAYPIILLGFGEATETNRFLRHPPRIVPQLIQNSLNPMRITSFVGWQIAFLMALKQVARMGCGNSARTLIHRLHHGSRAFHGTQLISESATGANLNRPLSPHLLLKKPQLSAAYLISHHTFRVGVICAAFAAYDEYIFFSLWHQWVYTCDSKL
ncbi:hypothetical protein IEQ34_026778 [Dendrobium chrysotoxum]|uniref:Uncharacterized protein n=1 Tax=Dendrobium chrysotoxum TaxID=161865 RepID=A0AAV7FLJ9_DENCH|nr:hypothetical protein IEQ34_026778 [Dendrobium chrysotoxum]